jgi:glycosyltransferase involved in cell wall biosynthesis
VISIIILTFNKLNFTRQCLESINARTHGVEFEVIVVDNASSDETPQFLQEFAITQPNVKLFLNETNLGFAAGNNQGAAAASGDTIVFLNNDTVVTEGWLDGLLRVLEDHTVGMVGPVTNEIGNESCIEVDYSDLEDMPDFARRYTLSHAGQHFEIDVLAFFCVALRREVFEEIGPLDEQFGVGLFEDDDYAMRLKQQGYKLSCTEEVFIHHVGSGSFSLLGLTNYWKLFDANRKKFETKWGIEWEPHLKRPELLPKQVRQMVDSTSWHVSMIAELRQQRQDLEQQVALQQQQLEDRQKQLQATEQALEHANVQVRTLTDIYASRSWKFIQFLRRIRLALAPEGSRRERFLLRLFQLPHRISQALTPPHISWYAYFFQRYQRDRRAICTDDLSTIQCPTQRDLVSIVLPVYNGADYLAEAIESVLNQTYSSFELIIVDDGSTDDTPQLIAEFAAQDTRIRVISQENQRLPRALSNGFQAARGEFLTWTSADNRLKPEFVERLVDCLRRHPKWEFIYANQDIIDERGAPLRSSDWFIHYQEPPGSEHVMLPIDPLELNVYSNNYVGGAFMYRDRAAALIGDYSPRRFGIEDYDYWMRVNALLTLQHADFTDPVYEYRFHEASLTSQDAQLGITRNRVRLMTFDDFRRDFYLTPLIWWIESGDQPEAAWLIKELRQRIIEAGHLIYEQVVPDPSLLPPCWIPIVKVRVADPSNIDPYDPSAGGIQPQAIPPIDIMEVLVTPSSKDQSETVALAGPNSQFLIRNSDLPTLFTAIDILARGHYLDQIEALAENPPPPVYKASVVICTYRRGAALAESLRSVAQQSFPAPDFEIIVVNNDPADETVENVVDSLRRESFAGNPAQLKHLHCPLKGLSFARNAGIAAAVGEVVCFLDDDAIARPDWLEQIWQSFCDHPQAGVIGGLIRLNIPQPRPSALKPGWEKFWSEYLPGYGQPTVVTNWWELPWGANWCARRKALLEIGGFRSRYGRRGSDFGGGEELVAARLIQALGYQVVVNPSAEVLHLPDPRRFTWKHVWRTIRAGKRNQYFEQIDLYLPMELSLRYFAHNQANYIKTFFRPKSAYYHRLEAAWYSWIEFSLTFRWLGDRLARLRRRSSFIVRDD